MRDDYEFSDADENRANVLVSEIAQNVARDVQSFIDGGYSVDEAFTAEDSSVVDVVVDAINEACVTEDDLFFVMHYMGGLDPSQLSGLSRNEMLRLAGEYKYLPFTILEIARWHYDGMGM